MLTFEQTKRFLYIYFKSLKHNNCYSQYLINVKKYNQYFINFIEDNNSLKECNITQQYIQYIYHINLIADYTDMNSLMLELRLANYSFPLFVTREGNSFWTEYFDNFYNTYCKSHDYLVKYVYNGLE